jgi:hypothetical protein
MQGVYHQLHGDIRGARVEGDLKAVAQRPGETLHRYIQFFCQIRSKISKISDEEVISIFFAGSPT